MQTTFTIYTYTYIDRYFLSVCLSVVSKIEMTQTSKQGCFNTIHKYRYAILTYVSNLVCFSSLVSSHPSIHQSIIHVLEANCTQNPPSLCSCGRCSEPVSVSAVVVVSANGPDSTTSTTVSRLCFLVCRRVCFRSRNSIETVE